MKNYWLRIAIGALGIFAVGMVIVTLVRGATAKVRTVAETAEPIRIPFPGTLVPFRVDSERLGSLKQVTIYRSAPKVPERVEFEAQLADSVAAARLAACLLVAEDLENINQHSTFTCMTPKDTAGRGLAQFGTLTLRGHPGQLDVLAWKTKIEQMKREWSKEKADSARDSVEAQAERVADSIETAGEQRADSIEAVLDSQQTRLSDSLDRQRGLADSIRAAAREAARTARSR
ncbi:MAG TPA: hypothetical protein VFS40_11225 [Gemmatimonadales bacterium]|nr:hypothetical protein [Gemmatimonadales bacterium]